MTRTLRTNAAYAALAYRKSILTHTINLLQRDYTNMDGVAPSEQIICEDVFFEDRQVPVEEVQEFIEHLEAERAQLDLELRKFQFVRRDHENERSAKVEKNGRPGAPNGKGGKGNPGKRNPRPN